MRNIDKHDRSAAAEGRAIALAPRGVFPVGKKTGRGGVTLLRDASSGYNHKRFLRMCAKEHGKP